MGISSQNIPFSQGIPCTPNTPNTPTNPSIKTTEGLVPLILEENLVIKKDPSEPKYNITLFPDECVHTIRIEDKMKIYNFIQTPYLGEDNYRVMVFNDKMEIKKYSQLQLGYDAARSMITNNAGGASEYSEAVSMHYFEHGFNGTDFILETEVQYWKEYKMVDYICTIKNQRIGISVTRAMGFPCSDRFIKKDAINLLKRKINGLIVACDLVITKYSFTKSILHVWCQNQRISDLVQKAYEDELEIDSMGLKVLCDVTVILTICNDKDLYTNREENKTKMLVIK